MKNSKIVVGIIGLGSFGTFVARTLPSDIKLLGYDAHATDFVSDELPAMQQVNLETLIQQSNILLLAIPLASYKDILPVLKEKIRPEQLLVDICSVKIIPQQMITTHFPDHPNLLISHPLFGARSFGQKGNKNRLIVTASTGELADTVLNFCTDQLGIEIVRMSAEKHDSLMADIHAITFFVAKALENFGVKMHDVSTPSYKMITDLVNFSQGHTDALMETIENGNPYAEEVRARLVKAFDNLSVSITESARDWTK